MRNLLFFKTSLLILLGFPLCLLSQEDKPSNWDRKRIDARVITMDQDTFYGQVLKANESTLTMWMGQEPYDHKNSEIEIKEFTSNEINQIFLKIKIGMVRIKLKKKDFGKITSSNSWRIKIMNDF